MQATDKTPLDEPALCLVDNFDRALSYLRISITDRCNLRCIYCVPQGMIPKVPSGEILSYEEILRLVRLSTRLGIKKVRITGGEPLIRNGVYAFLSALTRITGLEDVSLTTNGVQLRDNAARIRAAGIRRINISLDTLQRRKFEHITGYDLFDTVWAGIEAAHAEGFEPIKLNVVALKGFNEDELEAFARLSITHPFHVRFIEYMPIGSARVQAGGHLLAPDIQRRIGALGKLQPVGTGSNDGPAQRFKFEGARGEIGFIRPISQHFCRSCNRLRLTANGQLRPCLLSDHQEDLKALLRSGATDEELSAVFLKAVRRKHAQHLLTDNQAAGVDAPMSGIGG